MHYAARTHDTYVEGYRHGLKRMAGFRSIGRTLFIYCFAVVAGGLLGIALGQMAIWGSVIAIKLIAPSTIVHPLLQNVVWPAQILFVAWSILRALRLLNEPVSSDEPWSRKASTQS